MSRLNLTTVLLTLSLLTTQSVNASSSKSEQLKAEIPPPYSQSATYFVPPPPIATDTTAHSSNLSASKTTATNKNSASAQLITDIVFNDAALQSCVVNTATNFGWTLATQVTYLKCENLAIDDIQGLQHLTNLIDLSLNGNNINDLTELAGLGQLQYLYLYNNLISDISALTQLTNLRTLHLHNNQISNLAPLAGLTALKQLYLSSNQITDISALSNLTTLEYLLADRNQIIDLTPLANLPLLKTLFLYTNQINDISALNNLVGLTRLNLSGNQISDLSALANMTRLEWLLLGGNQISNVAPLSGLTALQILDLNINNIIDISPLAPLTDIKTLYLGFNQIGDISALAGMTQVTTLLLKNNQLNDLSALANLTAIKSLHLQYNEITDVSPLANLTTLETLYLASNEVTNASTLSNLTNLTTMSLDKNDAIDCAEIDQLIAALGEDVVTRPVACEILISSIVFEDANLQNCVLQQANSNGWYMIHEVTRLNCSASKINVINGLEYLTNLEELFINGQVSFGKGANDILGKFDVRSLESSDDYLSIDNEGDIGIGTATPTGRFEVTSMGGVTPYLAVDAAGNVGVGTNTPTATFDITAPDATMLLRDTFVPAAKEVRTLLKLQSMYGNQIQFSADSNANGINWNVGTSKTGNSFWITQQTNDTVTTKLSMANGGLFMQNSNGVYTFGLYDNNLYVRDSLGTTMMELTPTSMTVNGAVVQTSSRTMKDNIVGIDEDNILDKLSSLDIKKWNYIADDDTKHIGPIAEDFYALFGLGTDEKHIATIDLSGVAIAGIKALNKDSKHNNAEIEQLKTENKMLKDKLAEIEVVLQSLINQ